MGRKIYLSVPIDLTFFLPFPLLHLKLLLQGSARRIPCTMPLLSSRFTCVITYLSYFTFYVFNVSVAFSLGIGIGVDGTYIYSGF